MSAFKLKVIDTISLFLFESKDANGNFYYSSCVLVERIYFINIYVYM